MRSLRLRWAVLVLGLALGPTVQGCALFDGGGEGNVFDATPGQCFMAPAEVTAQISELDRVTCSQEHDQEVYAVVGYTSPDGEESDTFPGDAALTSFADGACAEQFTRYVGVEYLDSSLFFTYLLPSPRSWQEKDRAVVCLAMDSGRVLTGSVKGSKR